MSMTSADLRRDAIQAMLARRAGKSPDAKAIAKAAADTWPQVAAQLVPVIGARGVDVLFKRALHKTSAAFPWLQGAADHAGTVASLDDLSTRLAGQKTAGAAEASHALLMNFVELLATLIGESLTERLLSPVWAPPLPASEQEIGS
jgi:hypothetical protein